MQFLLQVSHVPPPKPALSENASRAAHRPTVPKPAQNGMSKPKAPTSGGIVTGVAPAAAALMAGCSMKSHICSTRLTMPRARPGFSSAIIHPPRLDPAATSSPHTQTSR